MTSNVHRGAAVALAAALLLLPGCGERAPPAKRAFYSWRTTFSLSGAEREVLRRLRVERLYLRLFDVAWDGAGQRSLPIARCDFREPAPANVEVVPVVYLANAVFEREPDPAALAGRVWRLVESTAAAAGFRFDELQVDCDWSDRTRDAFFAFCRDLRSTAARRGVRLGATIRLHQVKYAARTGIPPVDRGMLMFYNMGRLSPDAPRSSIFDPEDAARYASFLDRYPLPLDAALPIFSWAVHGRSGRVVGLLEKPDLAALRAAPALRQVSAQRFVATEATLLRGTYLEPGDTLTIEAASPAAARQAARMLAAHFHPRAAFALALFDLDERNLKDHAPEDLEALFSAVR